jgi:heat shock protein HslJ
MKNPLKFCAFVLSMSIALGGCMADKKPAQASATAPSSTPPPKLTGTQWTLEDLGGKPVIASSRATLTFPEDGRAAGNGSCNRFTGTVDITGSTIKFGPLAATRMMCDPASTNQESEYLKALAGAEKYEVQNRLTLYLYVHGLQQPLRFHAIL